MIHFPSLSRKLDQVSIHWLQIILETFVFVYTFSNFVSSEFSVWSSSNHNLPYSIKNFSHSVQKSPIDTFDKLSTFICCLQHEINLFIWRREQFNEAKVCYKHFYYVFINVKVSAVPQLSP